MVFASAKGGVGKSFCTAAAARELARRGLRTAVLDLDFQGASAHLFLGTQLRFPEEEAGIMPLPVAEHLELMSFAAFSRERAVPLRGEGVREAMLELLAITIWSSLDFLLVDMPPGIGDELLDLLRFMGRGEFVVIATPSRVVVQVVERLLELLGSLRAPVLGIVENMAGARTGVPARAVPAEDPVGDLARRYGAPVLASLPYVPGAESRLREPGRMDGTLGPAVRELVDALARYRDSTRGAGG
ncbi:MAG: P-loop NTPase [Spirochaetales bacterium]|nr:P-loop NTPase [Spirochaetales bacterium]